MKYSIQKTNEKVAPYKLYRYDEYAGVPNNAELEFWMRIQELEKLCAEKEERINQLVFTVASSLEKPRSK